jgi:hypothetical protein
VEKALLGRFPRCRHRRREGRRRGQAAQLRRQKVRESAAQEEQQAYHLLRPLRWWHVIHR